MFFLGAFRNSAGGSETWKRNNFHSELVCVIVVVAVSGKRTRAGHGENPFIFALEK